MLLRVKSYPFKLGSYPILTNAHRVMEISVEVGLPSLPTYREAAPIDSCLLFFVRRRGLPTEAKEDGVNTLLPLSRVSIML